MKFSMIFEVQLADPSRQSERATYASAIEQAILADRLGFDGVWAVEHHNLRYYAHCTAPEVLLSYIAAKTGWIRVQLRRRRRRSGPPRGHQRRRHGPRRGHVFGPPEQPFASTVERHAGQRWLQRERSGRNGGTPGGKGSQVYKYVETAGGTKDYTFLPSHGITITSYSYEGESGVAMGAHTPEELLMDEIFPSKEES